MYCFCFPTPLLGMTELIPMLEFGMAETIQVHAVEACIMYRTEPLWMGPTLLPWLGEETKLPVNLL